MNFAAPERSLLGAFDQKLSEDYINQLVYSDREGCCEVSGKTGCGTFKDTR